MDDEADLNFTKFSSQWIVNGDVIKKCNILTDFQEHELDKLKTEIKNENEIYLEQHPEISILIKMFLIDVLQSKPLGDNIISAATTFFNRPTEYLEREIQRYAFLNIADVSQKCSSTIGGESPSISPLSMMSKESFSSVDSISSYSEFSSNSDTSSNLSSVLTENSSKSTVTNDDSDIVEEFEDA